MLCLVTQSCPTFCNPMDCSPPGSSVHGDSPGKHTGVDCHALLQRIFPTQGSNPGFLNCRWIFYCLSHQGSPRILEWVACPFSKGFSWPRNWTRVSCIAGGFFTSWATRTLQTLLVSAIIWKSQGTRKEIVTNVRALGIFSPLTILSKVLPVLNGRALRNYRCSSQSFLLIGLERDFPGDPVAKTPRSQCQGPGFNP